MSAFYSSTDYDVAPQRQLSAHSVLCPGFSSIDPSDRDLLLQKSLFLSQFLRLFMVIDGIFLVLWAVIAWPFFFGLLLIIAGFYGTKYYNTGLASMYGVYLLANMALRIWWLTMAHDVFDIVVISLGLAVVAYIFYLLCSFVWTLTQLTDDEKVLLAAYSNWDFGYSTPVVIMPLIVPAETITTAMREGGGGYYQQATVRPAPPPGGVAPTGSGMEGQPKGVGAVGLAPSYQMEGGGGVGGGGGSTGAVQSPPKASLHPSPRVRDDPSFVV